MFWVFWVMWFISFGTFPEFLTISSPKNTSVELHLNESKIYLSAKDDIYIQSHIQSQQRKQHYTYVWDKLKITVNTPQRFSLRTGWKKWKYLGLGRSSLLPLSTASYFFCFNFYLILFSALVFRLNRHLSTKVYNRER